MIGDTSKYTQRQIRRLGKVKDRPIEFYPHEDYESKQLSVIAKADNYNDRKININEFNYVDNKPFGYYTTIVEYNNILSFDMSESASNEILLKGDLFIDNIINISNGSEYIFTFKQDEVGGHSVIVNSGNINLFIANNQSLEDINKEPNSTTVLKISCIDDKLFGKLSTYQEEPSSGYTKVDNNSFSFDVEIASAGDTFTLPINTVDDADQYIQSFTADWGDDSTTEITSYDDSGATHTYAAPGTYTITMTGKSELFAVQDVGDKAKIVKLNTFFGDIGFKKLNFSGCSNLTGNIPTSFKNLRNLVDCGRLFRECRKISGNIPEDMFWNSPNITTFIDSFFNSGLIGEIPEKLFWYNPEVVNFGFTFSGYQNYMNFIGGIPEKLFWYNPEVVNFNGCFQACDKLTGEIPEKLFWNNPKVTDFSSAFQICRNLTGSIPEKLFWNNPDVTDFSYVFMNCNNIEGIPENLFINNFKAENFRQSFTYCYNVTQLPSNLFINNKNINNLYYTFYDNNQLTGDGWRDIIEYTTQYAEENNITLQTDNCFRDCTSLTDYNEIPIEWR